MINVADVMLAICDDVDAEKLDETLRKVDLLFTENCRQQEVILTCCFFLSQAYQSFPASGRDLLFEAIKRLITTERVSIH
jgi:hypothetical protein